MLSHNKFESCQQFGLPVQGHSHLTPLFLVCVRSLVCFTMFRFSEFPGFLMFLVVNPTLFHHFMMNLEHFTNVNGLSGSEFCGEWFTG